MNWKFQRAVMSHHNGKQKFNKHKSNKFRDKMQFQFKKKPSKFQKIDSNVSSLKSQYENYNSKTVQSFDDLPLSKETLKWHFRIEKKIEQILGSHYALRYL